MNRLIVLLGSNFNAEKNMERARTLLALAFPVDILFSENRWSAALVKEGLLMSQGETSVYLNAVCLAQTFQNLEEIQGILKKMEAEIGRVRGLEACGRVAVDLDLVEWNGVVLRPNDAAQDYFKACLADIQK